MLPPPVLLCANRCGLLGRGRLLASRAKIAARVVREAKGPPYGTRLGARPSSVASTHLLASTEVGERAQRTGNASAHADQYAPAVRQGRCERQRLSQRLREQPVKLPCSLHLQRLPGATSPKQSSGVSQTAASCAWAYMAAACGDGLQCMVCSRCSAHQQEPRCKPGS